MDKDRFEKSFKLFDEYNSKDPNKEIAEGNEIPTSLLYAYRMSAALNDYEPNASETLQLAARCQHIGRWEIPRSSYPQNRPGYLQWRSQLKIHHAKIAEKILTETAYDSESIQKVKDLLLKKHLKQNPETQILEDVICLVFLQYYFTDFSLEHNDEKLISILQKTIAKISKRGVEKALQLPLSEKTFSLIAKAVAE